MVKVRFGKKEYEALKKFERIHHPDIWAWIISKVGGSEGGGKQLKVLDISDEIGIIALMLAQQCSNFDVTCAMRGDVPNIEMPTNVKTMKISNYEDIQSAGKFDLILLTEVTKDIPDLGKLISIARDMLINDDGKIILIARPKNPPLPLPDCCTPFWRKMTLTREEVLSAIKSAELTCVSFSASVPVEVPKFDWEAILFTGCNPIVKMTPKCVEAEITNFCKSRAAKISFEEKLNLFLAQKAPREDGGSQS